MVALVPPSKIKPRSFSIVCTIVHKWNKKYAQAHERKFVEAADLKFLVLDELHT
jgi:ATP-dependent helicase YprA (DUF1998 family)